MAGIKFSNSMSKYLVKHFQANLEQLAQQSLKDTANKIEKLMTEFIKKYFYDAYTPTVYKRTYALLNSVTQTKMKKVGTSYQITIFLDPSKAGDYYNSPSDQHRFYVNDIGQVVPKGFYHYDAEHVFDLASKGIHGLPQKGVSGWNNNNYIQQSRVNFMTKLESEIDTDMLLSEYSQALKKNGFDVKVIY